ncbi:P-loop containing nucleoside triphosphate hydrolase protein [Xylaria flabelliformis]|nr:P-loop containing nucleoside triphosphate hydrolase protein [Xylaria flabelliformis]
MPSIFVCGDRSSGKSSLLSALIGMPLPVNQSLCSPLIFELVLCRENVTGVTVQIRPGRNRSEEEQQALGAFRQCRHDLDVSSTIKEAEQIIHLNTTDRLFCGDVIQIQIAGPTQPHVRLIDMPGAIPAENNVQYGKDAMCINSQMFGLSLEPPIILVVVSAERDFSPPRVFDIDVRTLGIITKPDTLDVGSERERFYIELCQNQKDYVHLPLGWHVLCNRPSAMATHCDRAEADFFARGVWRHLDPSLCGVKALRTRIGILLYNEIVRGLPEIREEVAAIIEDSEQQLSRLGIPRDTVDQKRQFLFRVSTAFSGVLKAAVDGLYIGSFFGCSETTKLHPYDRRLRTVIQNTLSDFAASMREEGKAQLIQDDEAPDIADPRRISRAQYMQEVKELMRNHRGCELADSYNPLVVSEIFNKQSLHYVTDDNTANGIYRIIIGPYLQELGEALRSKSDELLEPHHLGHPITYNRLLTERVRGFQAARNRFNIGKHLETFFGDLYEGRDRAIVFDMGALLDSLVKERELDMDAYPITMVIDTADAYYEIALEKIIDDVSVLAVERCLIQKLPDLFAADIICHLTDGEVHSIASESKDLIIERAGIMEKLTVLKEGLIDLGEFKKRLVPPESLSGISSKSPTGTTSSSTPSQTLSGDVKSTNGTEEMGKLKPDGPVVGNEFWESIGYPFKGKKPTPKGKQFITKNKEEDGSENGE